MPACEADPQANCPLVDPPPPPPSTPRVANFSKDVQDGENYTVLLNQLKPDQCSRDPLNTKDLHQRAEQVLQNADRIGCRKYLTPSSLVAGNPKLNLAFVAHLFNTWPGLEALEEHEAPPPVEDFDAEGEREARVFTLWLNSLDVEPGVYNLFEDLKVRERVKERTATNETDVALLIHRTVTSSSRRSTRLSPAQSSGVG